MHLVTGGELDIEVLVRVAPQGSKNGRVVGEDEEPAPVLGDGPGKIEASAAVQVGEQAAEVRVTGLVPGEQHRPLLRRNRLGADDWGNAGLAGGRQEMRDAVETVAVGQGEPRHTHNAGGATDILQGADAPLRREGGMNMQVGKGAHAFPMLRPQRTVAIPYLVRNWSRESCRASAWGERVGAVAKRSS